MGTVKLHLISYGATNNGHIDEQKLKQAFPVQIVTMTQTVKCLSRNRSAD